MFCVSEIAAPVAAAVVHLCAVIFGAALVVPLAEIAYEIAHRVDDILLD